MLVESETAFEKVFDSVFENYSDMYSKLNQNIKKYFNANLVDKNNIQKVLDVGNGGLNSTDIFTAKNRQNLELFVGSDINLGMLTRNKYNFRVNSDALNLPFQNESFDAIIVMQLIHHIGFDPTKSQTHRLKAFLHNLSPLLKKTGNIYIIEPTVSLFLKFLQDLLYVPICTKLLRKKFIQTYIFNHCILEEALREVFAVEVVEYKRMHKLFDSKWELLSPTLFLPWLKLPIVCAAPYEVMFCRAARK